MKQPVYIHDNVYGHGADSYTHEVRATHLDAESISVRIVDDGEAVYLEARIPAMVDEARVIPITGADLPPVRFPAAGFEDLDGRPATIDIDLVGRAKSPGMSYPAGPLADYPTGGSRTRIWG